MQTRFNGNVVPFADDATSTNRTVFGGTTQSDNIDDNLNADFKKGWEIVGLNDNPTREDFNAMGYTLGALTSYLYQMGIAEYNALQEYKLNGLCLGTDGTIYQSLVDSNIGNALTNGTKWKNVTSSFVSLTGDQTIAGIKTFSSFPITPSSAPTTNYQVANKKYVDDKTVASSETIAGLIELATTAEAQAGTDDSRAITPLKLFNSLKGSNQSLASNGYQKLHGGLIIQWGTVLSSAIGYAMWTYPIAFPTQVLTYALTTSVGTGAQRFTATIDSSLATNTSGGASTWIGDGQSVVAGQIGVSYIAIGH